MKKGAKQAERWNQSSVARHYGSLIDTTIIREAREEKRRGNKRAGGSVKSRKLVHRGQCECECWWIGKWKRLTWEQPLGSTSKGYILDVGESRYHFTRLACNY
jgi:hypothetical protein